jgi:uncharacterized protein with FMN-binding domain
MPRRAIVALVTTAIAVVLLISFKPPPEAGLAGTGTSRLVAVGNPPAFGNAPVFDPGSGGGSPAQGRAAPPADPGTGTQPRPRGTTEPPAAAPATPAPATPPAAGGAFSGQVTGPVVDTQFGSVQVQVTVSNGRIVDVTAVQLPFDRRRSAEISQYVEPILRSESLQAQSAQIDAVSGATYTSEAYAESLQGALDQAHG